MKLQMQKLRYLIYTISIFLLISCKSYTPISSDTTTEIVTEDVIIPPDSAVIEQLDSIGEDISDIKSDIIYVTTLVDNPEVKNKLNKSIKDLTKVQDDLIKVKSHLAKGSRLSIDKINISTSTQIVKEDKVNFDKILIYLVLLVFLVVVFKSLILK